MDRRQIATLLTLRELGLKPDLSTFEQRLAVQKSLYLVQAAGLDLGYFYNWYLRGPYSPDVSRDLFPAVEEIGAGEQGWERWSLDAASRARVLSLRPLLEAPGGLSRPDWLELVASVHFVIKNQGIPTDPASVTQRLRESGKSFSEAAVREALAALRARALLVEGSPRH